MLFSILKDSFILFLLIYALLTLAEKFSKFLEGVFEKRPKKLLTYRIVDIRDVPATELEIPLKSALNAAEDYVLLLAENLSVEAEHIVNSLTKDKECIQADTREQMILLTSTAKETKAFFTRGDDHSCHSNRSIFS